MVSRMKTTIDLPDALAEDAKRLALDSGTSLRELVVEGLRAEIERRAARPTVDFHFMTAGGRGIRADVSDTPLTDLAYGLPR